MYEISISESITSREINLAEIMGCDIIFNHF